MSMSRMVRDSLGRRCEAVDARCGDVHPHILDHPFSISKEGPMQPEFSINFLAVLVCVVVAMPVGFLWFGPLFGKAWAKHMGFEDMEPPGGGAMAKSMGLYALGSLLIAFVLAHSIIVWQPQTWGAGENQPL